MIMAFTGYALANLLLFGIYYLIIYFKDTGYKFGSNLPTNQYRNAQDSWAYINLILINSIILGSLFMTQKTLKKDFLNCALSNNKFGARYWLAGRTVEIKCILLIIIANHTLNLDSIHLKQYLDAVVKQKTKYGRVIDCSIIPEYSDQLELEMKRVKLLSGYNAYHYKKPKITCIARSEQKDRNKLESRIRKIEHDINIMRSTDPTGSIYAFFSLNSVEAAIKFSKFVV